MNAIDSDIAAGLLDDAAPPCLSIYQPTHRQHPDNQQDPIRFGNLVKTLEESLRREFSKTEVQPLLEPFLALANDRDFWNHTLDGLAVLGAKDFFRVYRLQRPVAELAVVAESFHTKPLLRILQSAGRYHVLAVNRHTIRLFEGNRDVLDEITPHAGVPRTLTEAFGGEMSDRFQSVVTDEAGGTGHSAMHDERGGQNAKSDIEAERFFRAVDRGILEHHSQAAGLPLMLAALPEHHHMFHAVSHNPFLIPESIDVHPDALSTDELRERAWQLMEPQYLARLAELVENFGHARSNGLGDSDLTLVARATVSGRVATMLIEARREVPGRIDLATGEITLHGLQNPGVDDLLDDLGTLTLKHGGEVVIVPKERMPTTTGVAATYRY